jgi:hypothetical protein
MTCLNVGGIVAATLIYTIRSKHQGYDDPQNVEGAYCLENI